MEIRIREMKTSDINAVYNIAIKTKELHSSDTATWYPKIALKRWLRSKNDDVLLVAEYDKKVVGFCLCYVHFRGWALLDSIVVSPKFRRKGIAKRLINESISRIKRKGAVYAQGLVRTSNRKTLDMMKKLGFDKGHNFYVVDKFLAPVDDVYG